MNTGGKEHKSPPPLGSKCKMNINKKTTTLVRVKGTLTVLTLKEEEDKEKTTTPLSDSFKLVCLSFSFAMHICHVGAVP